MDQNQLNEYIDKYKSPVDPVLEKLQRETYLKTLAPQMSSGPTQGRLLELISKMLNPEYILEIGTFTGFATLCLAKGLKENGSIITIDPNEEVGQIAKDYFSKSKYADNIQQVFGDAKKTIPRLEGPFDLVFIDAGKESYLEFFELVLPKTKSGGIILADNVLWYGKVWSDDNDKRTQVLHHFNKVVANDPRVENLILPLRDGINIIRKK
jgi:predicted O-methyltransferase YrrM